MPKERVDVALVARELADSREAAQRLVSSGRVRSGTTTFVKPSQMVDSDAPLEVTEPERYVSRGGLKLEGALREFAVDVSGLVCLDVGASTGGFTDCLLQHGAAGVLAVDVGRGQLHQKLRDDPRVVVMEGVNARALPELGTTNDERRTTEREKLEPNAGNGSSATNDEPQTTVGGQVVPGENSGESLRRTESASFDVRRSSFGPVSFFVADVSFISLRLILPSIATRLAAGTPGIVLLKPQFEAGRKDVPRGGVIRDEAVLDRVRREFVEWLEGAGWRLYGMIASPIRGGDGNTEYLAHLQTPENNAL